MTPRSTQLCCTGLGSEGCYRLHRERQVTSSCTASRRSEDITGLRNRNAGILSVGRLCSIEPLITVPGMEVHKDEHRRAVPCRTAPWLSFVLLVVCLSLHAADADA